MSAPDRRRLVERNNSMVSIRRQCELLGIARSGLYRSLAAANDNDAALMRRIDELFTTWPFLGSRRMTTLLRAEGYAVNRKRIRRLMREMGIAALGPKPRTTKPAPGHKIYPYLLRGLAIERPNQVWCADITYIPVGRGFLYLVAIMDWASRAVLSWRLSNTLGVERVDRIGVDQDLHLYEIRRPEIGELVVERGIALGYRFEPVVEVEHHLVEGQIVFHHGAVAHIGELDLHAAAVLAQL
jgi:hypothetical protein